MYASGLCVDAGEWVPAGVVVAGVGYDDRSSGPHVFVEIRTDERTTTDPLACRRSKVRSTPATCLCTVLRSVIR
ncbi:hypothetical protein [Georgenia muralis]